MDVLGAGEITGMRAELGELYRASFAEPPWHETAADAERYMERVDGQITMYSGITGLAVRVDGQLAGVVYGWPSGSVFADTSFHRALASNLPATQHHLLLAPALEVGELMVHPDHRGKGIGRNLLEGCLAGWDNAWLCTHPDAPARRLYESAGWQLLSDFTTDKAAPRVVYVYPKITSEQV